MLFLQRAEDAKRCYGTLVHTKVWNFGDRFSSYDQISSESFKKLLQDVYSEAEVDPASIAYLEADGSASKVSKISEHTIFLKNVSCFIYI